MTVEVRTADLANAAALASFRAVLSAAEAADGSPPFSDQAILAATQGQRAAFTFVSEPAEQAELSKQTEPAEQTGSTGSTTGTAPIGSSPEARGLPQAVGILGEGEIDLAVHPLARGRGIGGAAVASLLARADRGGASELRAWAHGENPAAKVLLQRAGFHPVRTLYRLALDPAELPAAIASARPFPAGFRVGAIDPSDRSQVADWVRVNAAAFADHPEQGAVSFTEVTALFDEPWFDPQDLILAYDDSTGVLAGYTWIKTLRGRDETETELYVLGVDPSFSGRGLGAALLGETLRRMREHRPNRITLYVDGENEHARELYARAGFTVDAVSTQWLRDKGNSR